MLCPYCLNRAKMEHHQGEFDEPYYECASCHEVVPLQYVRDYHDFPAVPFTVVGLKGHGKSVFFGSLLIQLNRIIESNRWYPFTYESIDPEGWQAISDASEGLERGELPESTDKTTPRPAIVRISSMPQFQDFHFVFYDVSGEIFEDQDDLNEYAWNLIRSRLVMWFVSLPDLDSPNQLIGLLNKVKHHLLSKGGKLERQGLLIVLTKWDEVDRSMDVPEIVTDTLKKGVGKIDSETWARLDRCNKTLKKWMRENGYTRFLLNAEKVFRDVDICAVSSLGAAPREVDEDGKHTTEVTVLPRGVMWPLIVSARHLLPHAVLKSDEKTTLYFSLSEAILATDNMAGGSIRLSPGDHRLKQRVSLAGDWSISGIDSQAHSTRIMCGNDAGIDFVPGADAATSSASLQNLSVLHAPNATGDLLSAKGATLEIEKSVIGNHNSPGAQSDLRGIGLRVEAGSKVRIVGCKFRKNHSHGILASDDAELQVEATEFHRNGSYGIWAGPDVSLSVAEDNQFSENESGEVWQEPHSVPESIEPVDEKKNTQRRWFRR